MSLKNCHECGKQVSSESKACPSCGAKVKGKFGFKTFLIIFFIISALAGLVENKEEAKKSATDEVRNVVKEEAKQATDENGNVVIESFNDYDPASLFSEGKKAISTTNNNDSRCDDVNFSQIDGTLVHEVQSEGHDVYVTNSWYGLALSDKKIFSTYFAHCLNNSGFASVFDYRTGKKLATYTEGWGYTNLED